MVTTLSHTLCVVHLDFGMYGFLLFYWSVPRRFVYAAVNTRAANRNRIVFQYLVAVNIIHAPILRYMDSYDLRIHTIFDCQDLYELSLPLLLASL